MEKRKRLAWGVGTAFAVHLAIAGLLSGILIILPKPLAAKIIEVNIVDLPSPGSQENRITATSEASSGAKEKTADSVESTVNNDNINKDRNSAESAVPANTNNTGTTRDTENSAVSNTGSYTDTSAPSAAGNSTVGNSSGTGTSESEQATGTSGNSNSTQAGNGNSGENTESTKRPGEGELANRPRLLSGGKTYPAAARSAGQQGTVVVHIDINANGRVASASVASSSGYPLLDNAAVNAVYSWTFSPATDPYGTPLPYSGNIPVEYDLH
jgi:protein TonB